MKNLFQLILVLIISFYIFLGLFPTNPSTAYAYSGYMSDMYDDYADVPGDNEPMSLRYLLFLAVGIGGFLYYLKSKNTTADRDRKEKEIKDQMDGINRNLERLIDTTNKSKESDPLTSDNESEHQTQNYEVALPKKRHKYKSKFLNELGLDAYVVLGVNKDISLTELQDVHRNAMKTFVSTSSKGTYDKKALNELKMKREAYYVIRSEKDLAFTPPK